MAEREQYTVEVKVDDTKARMVIDRLANQMTRLRQLGDFMVAGGVGGGGAATAGGAAAGRAPGGAPPGPATSGGGGGGGGFGLTPAQPGQAPQFGQRVGFAGRMIGGVMGNFGGLAGAYQSQAATPFSTAVQRGTMSAITGAGSTLGMMSGSPWGMAAGSMLGVFGGIINSMFQYQEQAMQTAAGMQGDIVSYNTQIGRAMAGGTGGRPINKATYEAALREGAINKLNEQFKTAGVGAPKYKKGSKFWEPRIAEAIANSQPYELLMGSNLAQSLSAYGFTPQQIAQFKSQYGQAIGYAPGYTHESLAPGYFATAGIGAMGRFRGLSAPGFGAVDTGSGREGPSPMRDLIAQAVSQGLRFSKVDEYLNTISSSIDTLGRAGLTTDPEQVATMARMLSFGYNQAGHRLYGTGIRAARVTGGYLESIGQARGMVFDPFKQALPHFALAAAAQRMQGPGMMGLAGGFEELAANPMGLLESMPPEVQQMMTLALGGNVEMAQLFGGGAFSVGGPMEITSKMQAKMRRGQRAAVDVARGKAVGMLGAAGNQEALMREQLEKTGKLLDTARGTLEFQKKTDKMLSKMFEGHGPAGSMFEQMVRSITGVSKTNEALYHKLTGRKGH